MPSLLLERLHYVKGVDPVADAFAATVSSDVVDMGALSRVVFIRHDGVGATGTSVVTVEACSDTTPSLTTAVPFYYRQILSGDTEGTLTRAAATGFTTTAGSSKLVVIEVREEDLADIGYRYVRAKFTESVDSPVLGGVLILGEAKMAAAQKASIID